MRQRFKSFFSFKFSRTRLISAAVLLSAGAVAYSASVVIPNTFSAGSLVSAEQMNANFAALANAINNCTPDMVKVGPSCVDKYEASIWETTDAATIAKIKAGTVTLADLNAAGAVPHGVSSDDYGPACPHTANGCTGFYAVSIAGVSPSRFITWFQAVATARNSGKRLPLSQEWMAAAFGTPDGTPCIVGVMNAANTGTAGCVSDVGAYDMVGNLSEWTADWSASTGAPAGGVNTAVYGNDNASGVGVAPNQGDGANFPAVFIRGGSYSNAPATTAGVFAFGAVYAPSAGQNFIGFRGAR